MVNELIGEDLLVLGLEKLAGNNILAMHNEVAHRLNMNC
jgi:hypothetical protein